MINNNSWASWASKDTEKTLITVSLQARPYIRARWTNFGISPWKLAAYYERNWWKAALRHICNVSHRAELALAIKYAFCGIQSSFRNNSKVHFRKIWIFIFRQFHRVVLLSVPASSIKIEATFHGTRYNTINNCCMKTTWNLTNLFNLFKWDVTHIFVICISFISLYFFNTIKFTMHTIQLT